MISAADLMKRVGLGGRLVPFFKCVCVYFLAGGGGGGSAGGAHAAGEVGEGAEGVSLVGVAAKCAPVLCLLLLVAMHHGSTLHPKGRYARLICVGLALSAVGDALLVWPQHFVAGMGAFALAHVAYLAAFSTGARGPLAPAVGAALYVATGSYLRCVSPPGALRALVPLYALLLATMTWRAAARALATRPAGHRATTARHALPALPALPAAAGAVLFLISDAILGYSLFGGPVPYKQELVMSTYYLAQLGIALSALEPLAQP